MTIYTDNENTAMITTSKTIRVVLLIKINKNLKIDSRFIISCNESLAEYSIINKISQLLFQYWHEYEHKHKKRTELLETVRKFILLFEV